MKRRSRSIRKFEKQEKEMLTNVARSIGSTMGSIAAGAERLGEKSRAIASRAGTLARKTRKRLSSVSSTAKRRVRTIRRKSR